MAVQRDNQQITVCFRRKDLRHVRDGMVSHIDNLIHRPQKKTGEITLSGASADVSAGRFTLAVSGRGI
jgi:hypothetical protein